MALYSPNVKMAAGGALTHEYYPRHLGVGTPRGQAIYEFLITGAEEIGVLAKVAALFASHKVDLNTVATFQLDHASGFVFSIYADFARADCHATRLVEELKRVKAIRTIEVESAEGKLFERFLFPVLIMNEMRAVVISANTLLGVEEHFTKFLGQEGRQILFEAGRRAGLSSLRSMRGLMEKPSTMELLANFEDQVRATGWGIFKFDTSSIEEGMVDVTVDEPLFCDLEGVQESWYAYGLAAGLIEGLFGNPVVVTSSTYKRESKELFFRLQEQTNAPRPRKSLW